MKKKTIMMLIGIVLIAGLNTIYVPIVKSQPSQAQTNSYNHCYYLAENYYTGPYVYDCYGCLFRPMKNPMVPSTCSMYFWE